MIDQWQSARRWRYILAIGVVGFGTILASWPAFNYLAELGIDFLLPAARWLQQSEPQAIDTDIALVVIDEATHNRPPFSEIPEVAWTPYLAQVLDIVSASGAAIVGFDIIFPKTLATPDLVPGFDRSFLRSIFELGRDGRLVMGEVRLSDQVIAPYEGQILAVGGANNVSPLHFTPDIDGVIRDYPGRFRLENGDSVLSFANELVRRTNRTITEEDSLIDFMSPATIPVYRIADLYECGDATTEQIEALFADRIILFGTWLDVEDRHMAANRFSRPNQPNIINLSCANQNAIPTPQIHRQSVPGVFLHALAIQTILSGTAPKLLSSTLNIIIAILGLATLAWGFLELKPLKGLGLLFGSAIAIGIISVLALLNGLVLPYLLWLGLALSSYLILYSYRVFFEDQQRRWIRHAFRHYLSPHLVDQLAENPELLKLGGERRQVVSLFLDLAGFTSLSEAMSEEPESLVRLLNGYLTKFSELIEAEGGYVDKYVGDAIMAVWGAPISGERLELAAASAAVRCCAALKELKVDGRTSSPTIAQLRIGLHAGDAVAGNVGSEERFNYTVIGDSVNLAARLESANKNYGTSILASEDLVQGLDHNLVVRVVDKVVVAGRSQAVRIFEIVGFRDDLSAKIFDRLSLFEEALNLYLSREFETARREFDKIAQDDPVAQVYSERAKAFAASPPDSDWDGTVILTTK